MNSNSQQLLSLEEKLIQNGKYHFSVSEVSELFGVPSDAVKSLLRFGQLRALHAKNGCILIDAPSVAQFLDN